MKKLLYVLVLFSFSFSYCQKPLTLKQRELRAFKTFMETGDLYFGGGKFTEAKSQYDRAYNVATDGTYIGKADKNKAFNKAAECTKKLNEPKPIPPPKIQIINKKPSKQDANPKKEIKIDDTGEQIARQRKINDCENRNRTLITESIVTFTAYGDQLYENKDEIKARDIYNKILEYDNENENALQKISKIDYQENKSNLKLLLVETNIRKLLYYLEYSLDDKKMDIATLFEKRLLELKNDITVRDKIGDLYFEKTGTSRFNELFMSYPEELELNYQYFTYYKNPFGKSNEYKREYYSNLVELDLAYAKANPDIPFNFNENLSINYNSLGWYSILTKKLENALDYFNKSKEYDKTNMYPDSNIPHVYLLTHQFEKARELYKTFKKLPFDKLSINKTYGAAFLSDFSVFEKAGIIEKGSEIDKQIADIKVMLQE